MRRLSAYSAIIFLAVTFGVACSQRSVESDAAAGYLLPDSVVTDWLSTSFETTRIVYPPGHLKAATMPDFAQRFAAARRLSSDRLGLEPIDDTMIVFLLTGPGQSQELLATFYPFARTEAVYFWQPSFIGPPVIDWLLAKHDLSQSDHAWIRHGIRAWLDWSGQNYHEAVERFAAADSLLSLVQLDADTAVDSDRERYQSAHAASFVEWMVGAFGAPAVFTVYQSKEPFAQTFLATTGIGLVRAEAAWATFRQAVVASQGVPDATPQE